MEKEDIRDVAHQLIITMSRSLTVVKSGGRDAIRLRYRYYAAAFNGRVGATGR